MAIIWANLVSEAAELAPELAAKAEENAANLESADLPTATAARDGRLMIEGLNLLFDLIKYMDEQQSAPARSGAARRG